MNIKLSHGLIAGLVLLPIGILAIVIGIVSNGDIFGGMAGAPVGESQNNRWVEVGVVMTALGFGLLILFGVIKNLRLLHKRDK